MGMNLFESLRDFVGDVVDFGGDIIKGTVEVVSFVTIETVAGTIDTIAGDNSVSDGLRDFQEGVSELTTIVVDNVAGPITKAVINTPIRKVERVTDVVGGIIEGVSGNEDGFQKAAHAGFEIAAIALTAGAIGVVLEHADVVAEVTDGMSDLDMTDVSDHVHNSYIHFGDSSPYQPTAVTDQDSNTTLFPDGTQVQYAPVDSQGNVYKTPSDYNEGNEPYSQASNPDPKNPPSPSY